LLLGFFCYKFMPKYLKMKILFYFLKIKNVDIIIMTSMNYYYFQFCGVVQMMMINKNMWLCFGYEQYMEILGC